MANHPHHYSISNAYDDSVEDDQSATGVHLLRRATVVPPLPFDYSPLLCGLVAGVAQAGIFNPYDRALFLSVKDHRAFFDPRNWKNPYSGVFQSVGGRAAAGGLYFPLEHFFLECTTDSQFHHFGAGSVAGAVNACLLNPLSAIKYKTWSRSENRGMWTEAVGMLRKSSGSIRPFLNGLPPTLYRDIVFGGCYTWLRLQIPYWYHSDSDWKPHEHQWMGNLVAAGLATVASGPFNYVRNVQYGTSSRIRADGTWQVLRALVQATKEQPAGAPRWRFLQSRLRIGWGTARVAFGMSFAHGVYDWLLKHANATEPY
jgi:hypothetical protein